MGRKRERESDMNIHPPIVNFPVGILQKPCPYTSETWNTLYDDTK